MDNDINFDVQSSSPQLEAYDGFINLYGGEVKNIRYGVVLGQYNLLLKPRVASELVKNVSLCALPNTAKWVKGVFNLRGNLVPVFNLHQYLDESSRDNTLEKLLLVVGSGEDNAAIYIDDFPVAIDMDEVDVSKTSSGLPAKLASYSSSSYEFNDQHWHEVDFAGLFMAITAQHHD